MSNRIRLLSAVGVMALLLAACGGSSDGTTTTAGPTSTTVAAPEAMLISYKLVPGTTHTFELEMNQRFEMTSTGDASALESEDLPGQMTMKITGPTIVTYTVADGPEPGTYELTVSSDLSGLDFDITVDGEKASPDDIPEFAELEPVETTIVVDEHGNPVGGAGESPDDLFGGIFGGLGDFSDMASPAAALDPGQFFGPILSDKEVEVGDSWTETTEIPLFGDDVATTKVTSTLDRFEKLGGADVMVIETVISNSEIRFDMAEFLIAMFEGFMPGDASDEDRAQLDQFRDELRFLFSVDAAETNMTTWFDPDRGMAIQSRVVGQNRMAMDVNMPSDDDGEMVAFAFNMSIHQDMTYRLVDSANA